MPRIVPPPTRYDPLRLAQAKPAAPAVRMIAIPPTRFDPDVQHHATGVIQRAAAAAAAAAPAAGGGGAAKSNNEDTLAMKFARTMPKAEADKWLKAEVAVIGSDKKNFSPVYDYIAKNKADNLSMWLVHYSDGAHTNRKNLDWLNACIKGKKDVVVLNPSTVGIGSFVSNQTEAQLLAAKPIKTEHEAGYLLANNYVWQAASGKLAAPK